MTKPLVRILSSALATLILGGILLGCTSSAENANCKTIYVGANYVDCVGVAPQKCLLVKEKPEDEWGLFYDQIEGFLFEPGYEYELIVEIQPVENPPQDGSMIRTSLVEVVSKTSVSQETPGQPSKQRNRDFLAWGKLENAAYPNPWSKDGIAQLVGGEFYLESPQALQEQLYLGLTPYRYYGDLDGDDMEDAAVIMLAEDGNNNLSTHLVMVLNRDGTPEPLMPEPLGERVFVRSVDIQTGQVRVDLDIFDQSAPACCPTKSVQVVFNFEDGRLHKSEEASIPAGEVHACMDATPLEIAYHTDEETKQIRAFIAHNGIDLYQIRGLAGQVLDVRIDSPHDDILLSITGLEDGKILATVNAELTSWSGELPTSQDYMIRAVSVGGDTQYRIWIGIMGEGGRTILIPPEPYLIPIGEEKAEVYEGPGLGYQVIGNLDSSEAIHLTGKNQGVTAETRWWRVCCFGGKEGWIRDDSGEVVGSTEDLPVAEKSSYVTPEPIVAESPPPVATDKVVYLTFNVNALNQEPVVQVLQVLAKYNARATFFLNRTVANLHPDLIQRLIEAGHTTTLQTSSSGMITRSSRNQYVSEITSILGWVNNSKTTCVRPPYEASDSFSRAFTKELGYDILLWDIDSGDWKASDPEDIARDVIETINSGETVLMHIQGGDQGYSAEALEKILIELGARNYVFSPACK